MAKNPYTPKTREEFEAYARAMDEANANVTKPTKAPAKKSGAKAVAKKTGKK